MEVATSLKFRKYRRSRFMVVKPCQKKSKICTKAEVVLL